MDGKLGAGHKIRCVNTFLRIFAGKFEFQADFQPLDLPLKHFTFLYGS